MFGLDCSDNQGLQRRSTDSTKSYESVERDAVHRRRYSGRPASSALEVVPLLILDAWDFIRLTKNPCEVCTREIAVSYNGHFTS